MYVFIDKIGEMATIFSSQYKGGNGRTGIRAKNLA